MKEVAAPSPKQAKTCPCRRLPVRCGDGSGFPFGGVGIGPGRLCWSGPGSPL